MVDLIRQTYGNDQVISHGDFVDTGRNILKHKDIAFVSGHFGFEYAAPLIKGSVFFYISKRAERQSGFAVLLYTFQIQK